MKFKKDNENVRKELENSADDVMQEMDEASASEFAGGFGNPFANVARVPVKEITEDVRNRV